MYRTESRDVLASKPNSVGCAYSAPVKIPRSTGCGLRSSRNEDRWMGGDEFPLDEERGTRVVRSHLACHKRPKLPLVRSDTLPRCKPLPAPSTRSSRGRNTRQMREAPQASLVQGDWQRPKLIPASPRADWLMPQLTQEPTHENHSNVPALSQPGC